MVDTCFNVGKLDKKINLEKVPEMFPRDNTGNFVISKIHCENEIVFFKINHGKANSDELRNIETGSVSPKDINEIDGKNDYLIVKNENKLAFYTSGIKLKEINKLLNNMMACANIHITSFYSRKEIISKIEKLSEIVFMVKPQEKTKALFGQFDELSRALKDIKSTLFPNKDLKEVSLSIKFDTLKLDEKGRNNVNNILDDLNYDMVSMKTSWMDDRFSSIINSNDVITRVSVKNITDKNGNFEISSLISAFNDFWKTPEFMTLCGK